MKKLKLLMTLGPILVAAPALLSVGCQKKDGATSSTSSADLKTDEDKAFYALGVMFGSRLKEIELSNEELSKVQSGLRDSALGQKPQVDVMEFRAKIDTIFKDRIDKMVVKNKEAGKTFLGKFQSEEGVQKTASGLAYKVEKKGEGKVPKPTDTVEVHYKGTLVDGTVFDSSYDRNQTINFPLNQVIPGWTEGLQLIGEGGKIKLVIPSDLAYGDRGAPPNVPGGSTLVFEVELFKVTAAGAQERPAAPGAPAPKEAAKAKKKS